jgi:DNA-binding winged helix-turn-helix (wHTH) protein
MDTASPSQLGAIRFGVFELDLRAGELRKQGVKIKLQEQPFQVLQVLLERPGEVVTQEELRQRIWPSDTFVDFDGGVNNAIKRLSEAQGDKAETPRFIETLPRRAYRFIGTVNWSALRTSVGGSLATAEPSESSDGPPGLYARAFWYDLHLPLCSLGSWGSLLTSGGSVCGGVRTRAACGITPLVAQEHILNIAL